MNTLLLRFVTSASLARSTNEGLALALVLLAHDRGTSTAQAGTLVAASTLPQLATGPLLGPVLDRSHRPWSLLRGAAVVMAVAAVGVAVSFGRAPFALPLLAAAAMSCVEPLLNGGLSAIGSRGAWATRVFAWDSLAYNIAGLAGPAVVTAVALLASPAWSLAVLGGACAAIVVTSTGLTATPRAAAPGRSGRSTVAEAIRTMASNRALRAVTLATTVSFVAYGALSFSLVAAVQALGRRQADAGVALTISAAGGLAGSLLMTRRRPPLRPERTVITCVAAMGVVIAAMGSGSWTLLLCGAFVVGVLDGPLLVGLFATRSEHSPAAVRATVFTVGASAKLGAASIGALAGGVLLDGRATGLGLVIIGAGYLVAAAIGTAPWRSGARRTSAAAPSRAAPVRDV